MKYPFKGMHGEKEESHLQSGPDDSSNRHSDGSYQEFNPETIVQENCSNEVRPQNMEMNIEEPYEYGENDNNGFDCLNKDRMNGVDTKSQDYILNESLVNNQNLNEPEEFKNLLCTRENQANPNGSKTAISMDLLFEMFGYLFDNDEK